MKAITFLGASRAFETVYLFDDSRTFQSSYFGVALAQAYTDLEMYVFVTEQARAMHLPTFESSVQDHVRTLIPVDIPNGRNEEELWQIFEAVIQVVNRDEELIFDITHGFRSLPFLSFLATAYLRIIKNITLVSVPYGNFEARDQSVTPNRAPVVELASFVSLLDWMVAASRFIEVGDAQKLAERLREAKPAWHKDQLQEAKEFSKQLGMAAGAMDDLSLALRLIRPDETMSASQKLQERLPSAIASIQTYAQPLEPLVQEMLDTYAPLALTELESHNLSIVLEKERTLVSWYLQRQQYVQAMAVAREWLITWAMAYLEFSDQFDKEDRKEVTDAFGTAIQEMRKQSGHFNDKNFSTKQTLYAIPHIKSALALYEALGDKRNDLMHAGKRPKPMEAQTLKKQILKLCDELNTLSLPGESSCTS